MYTQWARWWRIHKVCLVWGPFIQDKFCPHFLRLLWITHIYNFHSIILPYDNGQIIYSPDKSFILRQTLLNYSYIWSDQLSISQGHQSQKDFHHWFWPCPFKNFYLVNYMTIMTNDSAYNSRAWRFFWWLSDCLNYCIITFSSDPAVWAVWLCVILVILFYKWLNNLYSRSAEV